MDKEYILNVLKENKSILEEQGVINIGLFGSYASGQANENILIENCKFYSTCNAFKFGTDTQRDFRNIYARNLFLGSLTESSNNFLKRKDCSTGITLETVDGGNAEELYSQKRSLTKYWWRQRESSRQKYPAVFLFRKKI